MYMADLSQLDRSLLDRAAGLADELAARAEAYDSAVLVQRRRARSAEALTTLCMVLVGASASSGLFDVGGDLFSNGLTAASVGAVLPQVLMLCAALAHGYVEVFRPRQKEQLFASAADACAGGSKVAQVLADARIGELDAATETCLSSMLTTLEASLIDNQPLIGGRKKTV